MKLESIGKTLAAGFGDKVLIGVIMGFLDGVTPMRAYEYIRDNLNLGYWMQDDEWQKYRNMARGASIGVITKDRLIDELRKRRTDILGVIINTDGGDMWLDMQVKMLNDNLGLS